MNVDDAVAMSRRTFLAAAFLFAGSHLVGLALAKTGLVSGVLAGSLGAVVFFHILGLGAAIILVGSLPPFPRLRRRG